MKLHELSPKVPKKATKRRGQGQGTGNGTFAGKGCKGQNSRSGCKRVPGFEGGQTPLIQRMPKLKGFRNPNRIERFAVNLEVLDRAFSNGDIVNITTLREKKIINSQKAVKILGMGNIAKKLIIDPSITISGSAKKAIEKAGGEVKGKCA